MAPLFPQVAWDKWLSQNGSKLHLNARTQRSFFMLIFAILLLIQLDLIRFILIAHSKLLNYNIRYSHYLGSALKRASQSQCNAPQKNFFPD
jgi:hypothetical protein